MRTIHGVRWNGFPFRLFSLTLIVFSISFASFVSIRAQSSAPVDTDNQSEDITVARISLIHGILSMMRGDDPDWFDINVNMPVQTGDRLYANDAGRAELQLGSNFFVRLDSKTGMDILELSSERAQLRMFSGSLVINLRKQPKQNVEIDTPSGAITLSEPGEFRINVVSDIKTEVIVWRGDASVFGEKDIVVRTGQRLILIAGEYPSSEITEMSAADNWDKWNQQRDYQLSKEAQSLDYIADNQSVEGAEDLSQYGNWTNTEEYGEVWTPSDVDSDWAPYQDGGWIWRDPCGWTWVSSEPWGWAPYHYGRWTVLGGRWCWVPGSDRHYSPAVVGFINHGTKGIGWVPLAPGDRFDPARARGRALDSKGVPYINQKFRNGTSIATRDGFAGGKSYRHGGPNSEPGLGTGRVVAAPPVVPTRASLATNSGGRTAPVRPTPTYFNRTVVTRNNEVPVVRSFTDKVAEIKANGGAPVSAVKLTPSGARATRQLIPENSPTRQIAGGGETQQPRGVAGTSQQTNTNQPRNGGLSTQGNLPQRQGGTQENQGTVRESQGNVYRSQTGVDQRQNNPQSAQGNVQPLNQKPQTSPSQSDGNINRPPVGRTTGREVERSSDNNRQQQPEQPRPPKPQAPDQQEQRRQQQQERDLQLQQQKEQESQRQQREREQQQQQEQDRQAQQQKEQESQRQQREREQQQQLEQDRQAQQQKEQEDQRQQREREQQQQEQDRQAQQQRDQENQRKQRDQQQEIDRRRQDQGEQERRRQQAEQERQQQQQAEQERQRQQQADQDRQRQQQADQDRQRQQQADQDRQRQQQADQERQRQQQAEQERQRQQQAEQERQQQQQAEQERQRQQQAEQERQRQQQAEQERQQQQQAEQERQRQQQAEQERQRQQQAEQERQRQQQEQERQRQQQQPVKKDPPAVNL